MTSKKRYSFRHNSAVGLFCVSEIFNIFQIRVFLFVFEDSGEDFPKQYFKGSQFLYCYTQHEIISKKTIVDGCLQYGTKQKAISFLVYDLQI